ISGNVILHGLLVFFNAAAVLRVDGGARLLDGHVVLQERKHVGQYDRRSTQPVKTGCMKPRIVIGTNTCGRDPSVVPSNPRGATPTMLIGWPLTIIVWFNTVGAAANRVCQYAWLSTTTCDAPTA